MTRLLSFTRLRERGHPYSKAHTYRLIRAGKFPRPIKVGENRIAWIEEEYDSHVKTKIAERDASIQRAGAPNMEEEVAI